MTGAIYKLRPEALVTVRLTREERKAVWVRKTMALGDEIGPLLKAGKVRSAIETVMMTIAAHSVGTADYIDALEDRIAALEAAAKPRVRVAATTRKIT